MLIENQSHYDYLNEKAVNQSMLTELSRSPMHLKYYLEHEKEQTDSMKFGSLLHTTLLTPERLHEDFIFIDDEVSGRSKEGKALIASLEARAASERKILVKEADSRWAMSIAESVLSNKVAFQFLENAKKEMSLYKVDEETGLRLKARVDIVPQGGNMIVDLKSTKDASKGAFLRSIKNYKYYLQGAFYLDQYNAQFPEDKKDCFLFIAVEKEPPFAVGVYFLNQATLREGRKEYRELLKKYKGCLDTNVWSGYTDQPEEVGIYIPDSTTETVIDTF